MSVKQITPAELKQMMDESANFQLLDVREINEVAIAAIDPHINIPISLMLVRLNELDPKEPVVVLCHTGSRSHMASRFLVQQGFEQVMNLQSGINGWSLQVDPSVPRY